MRTGTCLAVMDDLWLWRPDEPQFVFQSLNLSIDVCDSKAAICSSPESLRSGSSLAGLASPLHSDRKSG